VVPQSRRAFPTSVDVAARPCWFVVLPDRRAADTVVTSIEPARPTLGLQYWRQSRAERLIATGRLVLGGFSLIALTLDPSDPAPYAYVAYSLASAYTVYAALLAALLRRSPTPLMRLRLVTHVLDLAVFSTLMYVTGGPSSPFAVFLVFSLLCAMLRWQWHGVLWTTLVAIGSYVVVGLFWAGDAGIDLEPNRIIIHCASLALLGVMLGYLGAYGQQRRAEIARLAIWPPALPAEREALVAAMLRHAAATLRAPSVVMIWEEPEEPWLYVAVSKGDTFELHRGSPLAFPGVVAAPLREHTFLCQNTAAAIPTVLYTTPTGLQQWYGSPLDLDLQARFGGRSVLSAGLTAENVTGRLFFLNVKHMTSDDLPVAKIVAQQVGSHLDHLSLMDQLQNATVAEERVRFARDLHDGLLQFLAGAALQLERARMLIEDRPYLGREALTELQRLLASEQRHLRELIGQLKPSRTRSSDADANVTRRLEELCARLGRQWGLAIDAQITPPTRPVSVTFGRELDYLVQEGLSNAARHGGASKVRFEVEEVADGIRILLDDNGRGFPFRGRYDLDALTRMQAGPASLRERVASLGGRLTLDSGDWGTRLELIVPFPPSRA
jgi:signal transduction histidine kinase